MIFVHTKNSVQPWMELFSAIAKWRVCNTGGRISPVKHLQETSSPQFVSHHLAQSCNSSHSYCLNFARAVPERHQPHLSISQQLQTSHPGWDTTKTEEHLIWKERVTNLDLKIILKTISDSHKAHAVTSRNNLLWLQVGTKWFASCIWFSLHK